MEPFRRLTLFTTATHQELLDEQLLESYWMDKKNIQRGVGRRDDASWCEKTHCSNALSERTLLLRVRGGGRGSASPAGPGGC